jgi:S-DNA-T family DNA segregation ATPase FtsK/SpoIIIE
LIDYKGGAAFAECADLPHTLGVVTDLDAHLTARALTSLDAELRRRELAFATAGVADLEDYRASPAARSEPLGRLVLLVDEFASLADELPSFVAGLVGIAQRGRSLGVHLVLATQRPAGVVSAEIKANMALRIALRVTDPSESSDVIGTDAASRISKKTPGRAVARLADGLVEFQTARVGVVADRNSATLRIHRLNEWNQRAADPAAPAGAKTDLQLLRDAALESAHRRGGAQPATPWLPSLPNVVAAAALPVGQSGEVAFALADDPYRQRQLAVTHDLAAGGSIGLIGSARSGRTTAIRTFIGQAAARLSSSQLHVYLVDCSGGTLRPFGGLPHCGAVVTSDDPETMSSLIRRLSDEVGRRQLLFAELGVDSAVAANALGAGLPAMILAIDGWESFAAASEENDGGRSVDQVMQLLRGSAAAGLTTIVAGDRAVLGIRIAASLGRKFLFELNDRTDYAILGIAAKQLPAAFTPGRAMAAEDGHEVQFALIGSDPQTAAQWQAIQDIAATDRTSDGPAPLRIRPLPERITPAEIAMPRSQLGTGRVLLGVGGDGSDPITLELSGSDCRFLVAGPARSGRSTVLIGLIEQLIRADPNPVVAAPERSPLAEWAHRRGIEVLGPRTTHTDAGRADAQLIVIDDAEQFTDTVAGDQLTEWMSTQHGGGIVLCAARSEDLMISFRGLAVAVRRARTGLLLQPTAADGELLGLRLGPQRRGIPVPGRGLLVTDEHRAIAPGGLPVQVAAFTG